MSKNAFREYYRRSLPHYQPPGATIFITFRLAGSIPVELVREFEEEAQRKNRSVDHQATDYEAAHNRFFTQWDEVLDRLSTGPHWLAEDAVAQCVCDAMHFLDGKLYRLHAYCVMPTHVHLLNTPLMLNGEYVSLAKIMHSLKSYTAHKANILLGRTGEFWHDEWYDHVVRSDAEFKRIVEYVLANPTRAGLPERWVYWAEG